MTVCLFCMNNYINFILTCRLLFCSLFPKKGGYELIGYTKLYGKQCK